MSAMNGSRKTSEILLEIKEQALKEDKVIVGDYIDKLGKRGIPLAILICALPNVIPLAIPVLSTLTGFLIIMLTLQIIFKNKDLWLPSFIDKRKISVKVIVKVIDYSFPVMRFIEKFSMPRYPFLLSLGEGFSSFVMLVLAVVLFLPIPLVNFIMAFLICLISISLIERDGLLLILGSVAGTSILLFKYTLIITIFYSVLEHLGFYI